MMKFSDIAESYRIASEIHRINSIIRNISEPETKEKRGSLGVTIEGRYQEHDVVNAARAGVISVFRARREELLDQLSAIGVDTRAAL